MRTTIDAAGRLVVPKLLRERLGFAAGTELELTEVDGRLEVEMPSRIRAVDTDRGPVFHVDDAPALTAEQVRELLEEGRR